MTALTVDVSEFNRKVREFAEKAVPAQLVQHQQKIALGILKKVIFKTPVRYGRARGGWQVDIDKLPTGDTPLDKTGNRTLTKGTNKILKLHPFQSVLIVNNVEYIIYLEGGSSEQAAEGMLGISVQEVTSQFG